jgi:hypothetical protein
MRMKYKERVTDIGKDRNTYRERDREKRGEIREYQLRGKAPYS